MTDQLNYEEIDSFDFSDIREKSIPVKGPDGKDYTLREASAGVRRDYQNAAVKGMTFKDSRAVPQKVDGIGDLECLLVGWCLYTTEETPKKVGNGVVSNWPNKVVSKLYNWIRKNSGFEEMDEEGKLKGDEETKN